MTKVYILSVLETTIGAYSSLEKAKQAADQYLDKLADDFDAYEEALDASDRGEPFQFNIQVVNVDQPAVTTPEEEIDQTKTISGKIIRDEDTLEIKYLEKGMYTMPNFKLRKNNLNDNPDYKYELDIDTDDVKLISQIINSTSLFESNDETGMTLYSNNKQALLDEKQRIEQLVLDAVTNEKDHPTPNTELSQTWRNPVLEKRFQCLQQLAKQGWRIELETIDQIDNGYWHLDPITKLPYPNQKANPFGDIPSVTYTTYVYPPTQDDFVEKLQASFNTPLEAYKWLVDEQHLQDFVKAYDKTKV